MQPNIRQPALKILKWSSSMLNSVPTGANVEYHARKILEKSRLRSLIRLGLRMAGAGREQATTSDELIHRLYGDLELIAGRGIDATALRTLEEAAHELKQELLAHYACKGVLGAPTSFNSLDTLTGGFAPGDLWVWAARPNTGKTRVLLYSLACAALTGEKVGFISLDMAKNRLMQYLLTTTLSLTGKGKLTINVLEPVATTPEVVMKDEVFEATLGGNFLLAMNPRDSMSAIEGYVRKLKEAGCSVVAIDQCQNIRDFIPGDHAKMAEVWKGLKRMARHYELAVVVVHQLNRVGTDEPRLEHLKDTGCAEEQTDFAIFLHDGPSVRGEAVSVSRQIDLIIAKSRHKEKRKGPVIFNFQRGIKEN